jgi:transposase
MSRPPRRKFSEVQKTNAALSHVQDAVTVPQVCEDLGKHPNQYYEWQKQAFFGLIHEFSRTTFRQERSHQSEFDNLKSKLSQKDEVIAELLTEHITLKKDWGEGLKVQWVSASVRGQIVDLILRFIVF